MSLRRKREKFQQLTEFDWGRTIGLQEGGFSYRAIVARLQRNSSTAMRVLKKWNDEHRTTRKTGSGQRKVTSACDDRNLLSLGVNYSIASFSHFLARWSTVTGVLISASSIRRCLWTGRRGAFIQDPPHGEPSIDASAMGLWIQSVISWLAPSCLFRWITFQLVEPCWLHLCYTLC